MLREFLKVLVKKIFLKTLKKKKTNDFFDSFYLFIYFLYF